MADNLIDQELARLIAEERLKDLKADAEDKAFRVKWNDKELEFKDPKQLEEALNNYSTDMQKMMEEERERVRAEVRAEFAKATQAKTETTNKPAFNQDEFKELVEKGKVDEAISYAAKQGPLGQEVEQLRAVVAQQAAMTTAQNWLSMHPEIPREAYGEVLQKLGTALDTNRVPLTPQNLELVYSYGKQNNVFNYGNNREADVIQTQSTRKAPPSVPRNGGAGASGGYTMDDLTELLMNAPDDKVDALYAKIRKSFIQ